MKVMEMVFVVVVLVVVVVRRCELLQLILAGLGMAGSGLELELEMELVMGTLTMRVVYVLLIVLVMDPQGGTPPCRRLHFIIVQKTIIPPTPEHNIGDIRIRSLRIVGIHTRQNARGMLLLPLQGQFQRILRRFVHGA